jgi:hypothetical protein
MYMKGVVLALLTPYNEKNLCGSANKHLGTIKFKGKEVHILQTYRVISRFNKS